MFGIAGIILFSSQRKCIALGGFVEDCFPSPHRQEDVGIVKQATG
jgi:hypothetical protein